MVEPPSTGSTQRRGSTEPAVKNISHRGSTDLATSSGQSRRGSKEQAASPSVSRRGSNEPTTPVSFRRGSGEPSSHRRSFRRGSAEPSSPQVARRGSKDPRMVRGGSVEPASPKTFRPASRDSSVGSSVGILRRGWIVQPVSSQPLSKVSKEVSCSRRGPALFKGSSSSPAQPADGRMFNSSLSSSNQVGVVLRICRCYFFRRNNLSPT